MHTGHGTLALSLSSSLPPSENGIYVHSKLSPQLYCWRQCSLWPGYPELVFSIFGRTAQNNICSVTFNVQREIETAHTHTMNECMFYIDVQMYNRRWIKYKKRLILILLFLISYKKEFISVRTSMDFYFDSFKFSSFYVKFVCAFFFFCCLQTLAYVPWNHYSVARQQILHFIVCRLQNDIKTSRSAHTHTLTRSVNIRAKEEILSSSKLDVLCRCNNIITT